MFSVFGKISSGAGKLCGLALVLALACAGGAAAQQTVQSCTASPGGGGCYDFTITDNQKAVGFIEVQILYNSSGNITGIQAVYADKTGVAIPRAANSTDYAPAVVTLTQPTGTPTFNPGTGAISGLSFTFTAAATPGNFTGTVTVNNFNTNQRTVDISDGSGNFNCTNRCEYNSTASLPGLPIGTAIPEIDGGRLPHVAFLLAGGYLIWRRQRQKREISVASKAEEAPRSQG
ncbi:MAG: hypothetical protein K2Y29_18940 [Beijerinckiaceae bacterium]|nr:hypothetical protein [Beijerinckiaceae bacterium]